RWNHDHRRPLDRLPRPEWPLGNNATAFAGEMFNGERHRVAASIKESFRYRQGNSPTHIGRSVGMLPGYDSAREAGRTECQPRSPRLRTFGERGEVRR